MAGIKITKDDVASLEFKADLAYKTLKGAVKTQKSSLFPCAESLYENLGKYLSKLTIKSTVGIPSLRKGGKRAKPIEGFILQCLLMHKVQSEHDDGKYQTSIVPDADDDMGGLKAYLDANDDPNSKKAELFKLIQNRAADLRKENSYDLILNAMNHVREKYQKS